VTLPSVRSVDQILVETQVALPEWYHGHDTRKIPSLAIQIRDSFSGKGFSTVVTFPVLIASKPSFHDRISDSVLVLGSATGTRRGEVSSLPADIQYESSGFLVEAYLLQKVNGKGISLPSLTWADINTNLFVFQGDLGAWVVHNANSEMYGDAVK
jgi:hypothetical protein